MRTCLLITALTAACSSPATAVPEPQPVAIAIVYQGSFSWMGEELSVRSQFLEQGPVVQGAYLPLRVSVDAALADLPPRSEATLVACGSRPATVAAGSTDTITSAAIGDQAHFRESIGTDLVGGLEIGLDALARSKHARKLLVVIGDGSHFDDATLAKLPSIGARLRSRGIVANAFLVVPNIFHGEPVVGSAMPTERVSVPWNLVAQLRSYLAMQLRQR